MRIETDVHSKQYLCFLQFQWLFRNGYALPDLIWSVSACDCQSFDENADNLITISCFLPKILVPQWEIYCFYTKHDTVARVRAKCAFRFFLQETSIFNSVLMILKNTITSRICRYVWEITVHFKRNIRVSPVCRNVMINHKKYAVLNGAEPCRQTYFKVSAHHHYCLIDTFSDRK